MELEWDESKRKANLRKHGLDFDDVRHLDWDRATYLEDERQAYPERRFWAFAKTADGRLHVVTFSACAGRKCGSSASAKPTAER